MDKERLENILKENEKYLDEFEKWLMHQKISNKTIEGHLTHVDTFINDFLCHSEAYNVIEGLDRVRYFFDDWYPQREYMRRIGVNQYASSIKKFYSYMLEVGKIDQDDYDDLCLYIKEAKEMWIEVAETINNIKEEA